MTTTIAIISVASILAVLIFVIIYSIKRTNKVLGLIDQAKTFTAITDLRNTLSPTKWSKDIDDGEKRIINDIILNMNKIEPIEIGKAFNHALRYEPTFRENLRKNIVTYLAGRLNHLRKPNEFDPEKLKKIEALANVIYHKQSIGEVEAIRKRYSLVESEVEAV